MSSTLPRLRGAGPARVGTRSRRTTSTGTTSGTSPEQGDLWPHDEDARRLAAQTKTFAEFLHAGGYEPPELGRPAVVQGHCHHKAVMGLDAERALLEAMGVEWGPEDWGCCGMAGSFGYEAHKYDISMKIGERHLLPAVRSAPDAVVIADGFSCRSQVKQGTGREALHTAQAVAQALRT